MGYTKNIAVIREMKSGFSADGGKLSGLIKAEKYGMALKVEASLINFAPLTEGKYVCAVSDGKKVCILDGLCFEGISEVDTGAGFAALICFVNGDVSPVASAVCGPFQYAVIGIREEIERLESVINPPVRTETAYEDEALAQENYYEYEQTDKDGGVVCENTRQKEDGQGAREDEAPVCAVEEGDGAGGLAHGDAFYARMKDEIEKVLSEYPEESALVGVIENSRWVRISYGDGKFYVFGVIYEEQTPRYICYGVPSDNPETPPASLASLASFIPAPQDADNGGYWVMYQDADTGASIKIRSV